MDFSEAIYYVQGHHEKKHLKISEECLANHIRKLKKDNHEEIGICKYFLLSAKLQYGLAVETDEEKKIYFDMIENLKERQKELELNHKKENTDFSKIQLLTFYNMVEGYLAHLHFLYDKHDFTEAVDRVYRKKMDIRLAKFWLKGKYLKWLEYFMLRLTSFYGTSFLRWFGTVLMTIFIFGIIFYLSDNDMEMIRDKGREISNYFYFSAVTIATLGYGDITPVTVFQKIIAGLEVVVGYIQLGILLILLQRKI